MVLKDILGKFFPDQLVNIKEDDGNGGFTLLENQVMANEVVDYLDREVILMYAEPILRTSPSIFNIIIQE